MAVDDSSAGTPPGNAGQQVAAMVEPMKFGAAAVGFAVAAYPTWKAGGAWPDVAIHGLLGAVLLGFIGWFVGLVLIREAIRAQVDEQRREYEARVADTRRQIVETLRARGHDVPDSYLDAPASRRQLGNGS